MWEREVLSVGKDHTDMLPVFRSLILMTDAAPGDPLVWAGCPGPCYSMATFFSYGLRDLGLKLLFAADGDMDRLWRLECHKDLGMVVSGRESPVRAKVLVLMSGLMKAPFEPVLRLTREGLRQDGVVIGETVVEGLFEREKWHEKIRFHYLFEFSMQRPTTLAVRERLLTSPRCQGEPADPGTRA